MTTTESTEVRTSVVVKADRERAFTVFTAGFDRWWPRGHHLIQDSELDHVTLEPGVGGRCYETATDGRTCTWGRVLTWDPPRSLSYTWEIQPDFGPVPPEGGPASTVTVTFSEVEGGTRVELVHSGLDVHGERWRDLRDAVGGDGGWTGILRGFADVAEAG